MSTGTAPSRWRGGAGERDRPVTRPGRNHRGTTGGPFPVAGGGESQTAATGELVARAVAVVVMPLTSIRRR
ncbi:hypothetical protein FKN01_13575 [Streptomyces sp. 130]|nr:hypothetical protein FKN01_13575 [Streptomyces sp. 130]